MSSNEEREPSSARSHCRQDKSGDSSYTYWWHERTSRCVSVRTSDGRYAAIVYTPSADCEESGAATQLPASAPNTEDSFDTVCGAETDGKVYRYKCRLRSEGCGGQGYCRTIVTMPDNEFTMEAVKGSESEIQVTFQGMNAQRTTSSFSNGQTRFVLDGKTYFVYRSPERAKRELAKLP